MAAKPRPTSTQKSATGTPVWISTVEFRSGFEARGVGATPEAALRAMIDGWQNACKKWDRGDQNYVHENRDGVQIQKLTMGRGYALGVSDDLWSDEDADVSDSRFDSVFAETLAEPAESPSP